MRNSLRMFVELVSYHLELLMISIYLHFKIERRHELILFSR